MHCPQCSAIMAPLTYDNQHLVHCPACGGTFFEENGINRISIESARLLAASPTRDSSLVTRNSITPLSCPRDNTALVQLVENPAVPQTVRLHECRKCFGVFAMGEDILAFKLAQNAKVNYLKLWHIPMPSIRSVMVISVVMFLMAGVITNQYLTSSPQVAPIQADELVKNVYITSSDHYVFIYFKTPIPLESRIVFTDTVTGTTIIKPISQTFSLEHHLTTGDLPLNHPLSYHLIVTDQRGNASLTKESPLNLQK